MDSSNDLFCPGDENDFHSSVQRMKRFEGQPSEWENCTKSEILETFLIYFLSLAHVRISLGAFQVFM